MADVTHEFSNWYDFHNFPRYDYQFHAAPNTFEMPKKNEGKVEWPDPWSTKSEYYQGIFCVVYAGTLFGLIFFALAALWNLCKNRKYKPSPGARKVQNYIISIALIFTVVSLAFAVTSDLEVNNIASVFDRSYKMYKGMWDTANTILLDIYDFEDTLRDIQSKIYAGAIRKTVKQMLSDVDSLKGSVKDFLSSATKVHWYSGSLTLKFETILILGQFTRFLTGCFIFWLLFMKPRWFYNTSLKSCGCVYILLNVAFMAIWIWCTVMLVYTIVISDLCVDVPATLDQVKGFFNLDSFTRSVVDYYTIGCTPNAVSPFQHYTDQMQQYINEAKLGLKVLTWDAEYNPLHNSGDFPHMVRTANEQFNQTNYQIQYLEQELQCQDINNYYTEAIGDLCYDLKSDVFICLIFQWAAILLTVLSRTCKCHRYREREVVVNENEYFGVGEPEPNILISASAPRLTEDLNAQLLDVGEPGSPQEIYFKPRYRSSSNASRIRSVSNGSDTGLHSLDTSDVRRRSTSNASGT